MSVHDKGKGERKGRRKPCPSMTKGKVKGRKGCSPYMHTSNDPCPRWYGCGWMDAPPNPIRDRSIDGRILQSRRRRT